LRTRATPERFCVVIHHEEALYIYVPLPFRTNTNLQCNFAFGSVIGWSAIPPCFLIKRRINDRIWRF